GQGKRPEKHSQHRNHNPRLASVGFKLDVRAHAIETLQAALQRWEEAGECGIRRIKGFLRIARGRLRRCFRIAEFPQTAQCRRIAVLRAIALASPAKAALLVAVICLMTDGRSAGADGDELLVLLASDAAHIRVHICCCAAFALGSSIRSLPAGLTKNKCEAHAPPGIGPRSLLSFRNASANPLGFRVSCTAQASARYLRLRQRSAMLRPS